MSRPTASTTLAGAAVFLTACTSLLGLDLGQYHAASDGGADVALLPDALLPDAGAGDRQTRDAAVDAREAGWTIEDSGTTGDIYAIWGSSSSDLYAVGDTDVGILHSSGDGIWTTQTWPSGIIEQAACCLAGTGPDDVYIGLYDTLIHSDGTGHWTEPAQPLVFPQGMWATSGDGGTYYITEGTVLLMSTTPMGDWPYFVPGDGGTMGAVWGNGNVAVAVGNVLLSCTGGTTDASCQVSDVTGPTLTGAWGSADGNELYAIGTKETVLHAQDGGWIFQSGDGTRNLTGIWGTSDATSIYAVADDGTILHSTGNGTWSSVATAPSGLHAVWGSGATNVFVVGDHGLIMHGP